MPRRLVTSDGCSFRFVEYELPPCEPRGVRVRVEFASPKHGTESHSLGGSAFDRKRWDPDLRMFLPYDEAHPPPERPVERGAGNMVVGTVIETGPEVTRFRPGDRVFGYGQIREIHQAPEEKLRPLEGLSPEDAVCVDPAHVAFVAVRDGNVRIGDCVAVFGLGAIGLLATRIAREGGALRVYAVDPIPVRRACAESGGADAAFDPLSGDAALEIKRATGGRGVDVSIETSGSAGALQDAIRCIRQCGTVVHVPWGPKGAGALRLDEEFHLNRPTIVGSQAWEGWGNPDRSYPLWDWERAYQATIQLFREKRITSDGLITPIVPFEDSPEAVAEALRRPQSSIKLGIVFGDGGSVADR